MTPAETAETSNAAVENETAQPEPTKANKNQWGELLLQIGSILFTLAVVAAGVLVVMDRFAPQELEPPTPPLLEPTATLAVEPPFLAPPSFSARGLARLAQLHTTLPDYSAFEIREYEVQAGDTVIGIADKFSLKPATIFYGNMDTLFDDPHRLAVGLKLRILPIDGLLYEWHEDDGLNGVAKFFEVTPEDILNWPGNKLNAEEIGDYTNPNIPVGTQLFIPGGQRSFISYSAPIISRADPASAKLFGPGYCGKVVDGYIGGGTFIWPTTNNIISGYDYSPGTNHWGIDIGGSTGNAVYASDSGVVVYSGLNNSGYGLVVIIDHGNGYQTLYAHLSQVNSGCGASVTQGGIIGAVGSTGRSTGPHLHFEIMDSGGNRINPHLFFQ